MQILFEEPEILRFNNINKRQAGRWIACIIAFNPVSYYYTIPYTESLFFMLTLIFMLLIQNKHWFLAGVTGLFAGITRNSGVLLGIIFVFEYGRFVVPEYQQDNFIKRCKEIIKEFLKFPRSLFNLFLIPLGAIAYFCYLYLKFGSFGSASKSQLYFGRTTVFPLKSIVSGISHNLDKIFNTEITYIFYYYFLELIFILFFLFAAFYLIKKVPLSYNLFMIASLLLPLIKPVYGSYIDYFGSFPRYTITLLPYFTAVYGILRRSRIAFIFFLAVSIYLLIVSVLYFCIGSFIA